MADSSDSEAEAHEDEDVVRQQLSRPIGGALLQSVIVLLITAVLVLLVGYGLWQLWKGARQ